MAADTRKLAAISLDDFLQLSTQSALAAVRTELTAGRWKVPPKIWIGIILDPSDALRLPGGPVAGGG